MNRKDYAKIINWEGTATREIKVDKLPMYKIGSQLNPGLCWTDGGIFTVESSGNYSVIFIITETVQGHQVDYENEEECSQLGCEDCEYEEEILIDQDFEVVDFWEYDDETKHAKVFLKPIKNKR